MTRQTLRGIWTGAASLVAAAALALACAPEAMAQATPTASRKMDLSVFGTYSYLKPDYGYAHDNGVTIGANFTRHFRFPIEPGIEARVSFNHGPTVNENTYLVGPRGQMDFGRYHLYADFLIGAGDIHYNFVVDPAHPTLYLNDNSVVKSPGGGIDIDVFRNFQLKADYQHQFWYLGTNDSLGPDTVALGITYRLSFRPRYDSAIH